MYVVPLLRGLWGKAGQANGLLLLYFARRVGLPARASTLCGRGLGNQEEGICLAELYFVEECGASNRVSSSFLFNERVLTHGARNTSNVRAQAVAAAAVGGQRTCSSDGCRVRRFRTPPWFSPAALYNLRSVVVSAVTGFFVCSSGSSLCLRLFSSPRWCLCRLDRKRHGRGYLWRC